MFKQKLNTRRDDQTKKLLVQNQTSKGYGTDTLRSLGPKIWNSLPIEYRKEISFNKFKELNKIWSGTNCKCNKCTHKKYVFSSHFLVFFELLKL